MSYSSIKNIRRTNIKNQSKSSSLSKGQCKRVSYSQSLNKTSISSMDIRLSMNYIMISRRKRSFKRSKKLSSTISSIKNKSFSRIKSCSSIKNVRNINSLSKKLVMVMFMIMIMVFTAIVQMLFLISNQTIIMNKSRTKSESFKINSLL